MDAVEVLKQWLKGLRIFHAAHFRAATFYARLGRLLGVPVVALTTIVGTTIFTTMAEAQDDWLKIGAGVLSLLAAILAGVQTFLDYSGRAQRHHHAGVEFGSLRREVEEFLAFSRNDQEIEEFMKKTRTRWDTLVEASPDVSQKIYDKAKEIIGG
jgi:hypothetical protein